MFTFLPLLLLPLLAPQGAIGSISGQSPNDWFGEFVSAGPDINGDGIQEILVGAPHVQNPQGQEAGAVYVVDGASGPNFQVLRTHLDPVTQWRSQVSSAGDTNGDGVGDYLCSSSNNGLGRVTLFDGATGGMRYFFQGSAPNENLGASIAPLGDIDQDGFDDFLAGTYGGLSMGVPGYVQARSGNSGLIIWQHSASATGGKFGRAVTSVGDQDGDGYPDVAVSAKQENGTAGAVYLLSGVNGSLLAKYNHMTSGDELGERLCVLDDLNGDGRPEIAASAVYANTNAGLVKVLSYMAGGLVPWMDVTGQAGDYMGWGLDGGIDWDGDGVGDLFCGAPGATTTLGSANGVVRVFSGADGLEITSLPGHDPGGFFGGSLAVVGDLTGDGDRDLAVSASFCDVGGQVDVGEVEFFETPGPPLPYLTASPSTMSASAGGTVVFDFWFPLTEAGQLYALLGSGTGEGPTPVNGVDIPLEMDGLMHDMASGNAPRWFVDPYGQLNNQAAGTAYLVLPAGAGSNFVGRTFWFAVVSYHQPITVRMTTPNVSILVTP